jgi:hypothetical protein
MQEPERVSFPQPSLEQAVADVRKLIFTAIDDSIQNCLQHH